MADRRRTREQWQSIVEGWPKSGLTQAQYCAQQGISVTSFHRWREQVRQDADPGDQETRQGEGGSVRWVPVELHEVPAPVAGPALTLVLANGLRLEVGADFEPRTLRRVLAVLQEPLAA
ncbi:transposase [Thiorhodococcus drewsii AZ1]|uniref:Transposase n=2 Tax=Thiorhodococcus drewsii AZ1 TaxID=765913 RepID=G2E5Y7_9GAMM|nr:hypothetical protein [Thiorhodococcus drewsii]EGV28550.1 transposase [Thiorhodococcus drewsii AZ1]